VSDPLAFLDSRIDLADPRVVEAYDELPLWSAMFGLLLLEEIPLRDIRKVLDVGCGTGFPLIELAERLGPDSMVVGVDPWSAALEQARLKVNVRGVSNVTLHEGVAEKLPFSDHSFDLVVSNLGVNNFENAAAALRECARVLRGGGVLGLTTNLQGHMQEFYAIYERVLRETIGDQSAVRRLSEHVAHRATVEGLRGLLSRNGFRVERVVERQGMMRFRNGTALLNHYFIRLGFLDAWQAVAGEQKREIFRRLRDELDREGELRLTIPMAYVEARVI
jgi:arsenite methyltransferase